MYYPPDQFFHHGLNLFHTPAPELDFLHKLLVLQDLDDVIQKSPADFEIQLGMQTRGDVDHPHHPHG